jgi:predicted NAD-dependent protein-ADP-ribosyltransferase YbiA (DUF1768 family)
MKGARTRLIRWAVRKKLEEHSEEIEAEMARIKSMRSVEEFKAYGREKGGELRKLWTERGPEVKRVLIEEYARFKVGRNKKKGGE